MLFSEPKIPQCSPSAGSANLRAAFQCSSASRKFLNFSTNSSARSSCASFSALQRAENSSIWEQVRRTLRAPAFSALQRAENSSMRLQPQRFVEQRLFQCSSASRKFLNMRRRRCCSKRFSTFSALQRAENSSIVCALRGLLERRAFSALQRAENSSIVVDPLRFAQYPHLSVLFSEPKIPQFLLQHRQRQFRCVFQCSSASRKFLNPVLRLRLE